MIDILLPAFFLSLVLLGIHSWFGLRIIERGIIFTDLAIGQMAALGAAVSLILFHGNFLYMVSLSFAMAGAGLIAWFAPRHNHLEALIGLIYAMGYSAVFILLSRIPHGMESFSNLMAYDIIFTEWSSILYTTLLYLFIGLLLYFLNRRLAAKGRDILFFAAFAVTVTSSVKLAGVLVVFAILLGPAFIALRIAKTEKAPSVFKNHPMITAWFTGVIINAGAITFSYFLDMPAGYSVVFINSIAAVSAGILLKDT